MTRGWIKLWRSCEDNPLYFSEPFTKFQAWIDLLILANHRKKTVSIRGILVTVDRGQVLAGEEFLAERWKWSRGKVRRFMAYLSSKTVQQIVQQKNNVCTVVSITNFDRYQSDGTANSTADGTTDGQQTVQQTDIPKNDKNDKNYKNADVDTAATAFQDSIQILEKDTSITNAIAAVKASHSQFERVARVHIENALKSQPDRERWCPAICGMAAKFAGVEMKYPVRHLENWLAGKMETNSGGKIYE